MPRRREWVATGVEQEVTAHRLGRLEESFAKAYSYAVASETHLWVATLAHRCTDATLDSLEGVSDEQPLLDADTLLMRPAVGCYVCEEPYEPRLRRRRCPGEPKR
jgi:hypothetical protein